MPAANIPQVSIITPTWNRCELLRECIQSVRSQSFTNWEHIIIDDGSDDGTFQMLSEVMAEDSRINFRQRKGVRKGANICRNQGIEAGAAPLTIFLDSDDLLVADCLHNRVETMERNKDLDFAVFQGYVFRDEPGDLARLFQPEMVGDDLMRFLTNDYPWQTSGPIWRRSSLERLGGFDESLPSWQDVDLHVRAICSRFIYLRLPTADHHIRWAPSTDKISIDKNRSPQHFRAAEQLLIKFEELISNYPGMDWQRQRALCGLYFFVARNWANLGDLGQALRCWKKVRERNLGPSTLYYQGAMLLRTSNIGVWRKLSERLIGKWAGIVRFRLCKELISTTEAPPPK